MCQFKLNQTCLDCVLSLLLLISLQNLITSVLLNLKLVSEPKNMLYEIQKHNELISAQI